MIKLIPTNGPMADERLSELRSQCLMAWAKDGEPQTETLDYIQALEGRYMDMVVARNREFLQSSIDQFRTKAP